MEAVSVEEVMVDIVAGTRIGPPVRRPSPGRLDRPDRAIESVCARRRSAVVMVLISMPVKPSEWILRRRA